MKKGKSLFSYFCSLAFVFFQDSIPVCLLSSFTLRGFLQKAWRWVWISTMHRVVLWVLGSGDLFLATFLFHLLVLCLVAQTCPTLCDPMDCSPPGSSVHRLFQARILEWVAISFSFLSNPGIKPGSLASQADSLPLSHQGSPKLALCSCIFPAGIQLSSVLCSTPRKPAR